MLQAEPMPAVLCTVNDFIGEPLVLTACMTIHTACCIVLTACMTIRLHDDSYRLHVHDLHEGGMILAPKTRAGSSLVVSSACNWVSRGWVVGCR